MGRTGSNHESKQGRIMIRIWSNHESNRVESWVEQGRIMSRIMNRTGSNHESNRVES